MKNTMVIAIWSLIRKEWTLYEVSEEYGIAIKAETSTDDLLMFVDMESKAMFALRRNVKIL